MSGEQSECAHTHNYADRSKDYWHYLGTKDFALQIMREKK